jgi:hypothetical protein
MRLYLVQHGEAKPEAEDPERSLTISRLLKNAHLQRYPHPSSLRRTSKYASLLRISGALHLGIFEQSEKNDFFSKLLGEKRRPGRSPAPQRGRAFVLQELLH